MEQIKISVRNLVEFLLRSGDIDSRHGRGVAREAMQEGSRIHRKLQRRMGAGYQAEVALKQKEVYEGYTLTIEGRADGIFVEDKQVTIDEIKGVYRDVHTLTEPVLVHLAQAKCYAYLYGRQEELEQVRVRMTYCNLDTEEVRYFYETYSMEQLSEWFRQLMEAYRKWADFQYAAKKERQESIRTLEFPFSYRDGQRDLVAGVYRTISRGRILFIQAPTGTGKTISTIFPAVRSVGEGLGEKIFYLTAKTIARTVARETFDLLRSHGYRGSVLTITAKEKLCLCEEMECDPVHCPYARGHYDRVNDAVFDLIQREKDVTREVLLLQAEKYQVCPFEMCLDTALWMDNLICDYNYVFDPKVYLKRFFAEGVRGDYIFLIDEAHNLVERGREMYSAVLYKEDFLAVKKLLKPHTKEAVRKLNQCNQLLLDLKRECEAYRELKELGNLGFALQNLGAAMDEFLQEAPEFAEKKIVLEFYFQLRHFLNMMERLDDSYVIYTQQDEDGRFSLKLYCVNPSANLQECLDRGRSAVFFSATLLPIQYYKGLLSSREDNYAVYAQTIFSPKQRLILVASDVSSKYTRRNRQEFLRIVAYIQAAVKARPGNYIVFFPSYKMMEQVAEEGEKCGLKARILMQRPGMTEQQREEFLQAFCQEPADAQMGAEACEGDEEKPCKGNEESLVGFCVMGGIFAEGIDLKGEQLIGVIVVGTGLPQISNEREILKNYYDRREGGGFDYAFRYPGMNKVMQAAGRVIRTVQDRGVILLLDERFLQREYQRMFPREWEGYRVCRKDTAEEMLQEFWEKKE